MPPKTKKHEPAAKKLAADHYLLIVESPSKCAKIESYLGPQYQCISSKGHIREIDGLSSINTKDRFQIEFTVIDEKRQHIEDMRKTVCKYRPECVYLATDDDREGEAIAWHICQVCDLDILSTKRIVFHEITQPALIHAVAHPTHINLSLVAAQQARQVLDLVVGFKISPLLWRHIGGGNRKNALSAGRCQTPALRLISDHHKQYKDAIAGGVGLVNRVSGILTGRLLQFHLSEGFAVLSDDDNDNNTSSSRLSDFFERTKTHEHRLTVSSPKPSTRSPPKPFNTSRLLQIASNQLRISPKTTMNLCQTLYQSGLITYMRTDCQKYARVFLDKTQAYITEQFGERFVGDLDAVELKDASMPHEAIRATNLALRQFTNPDALLTRMYGLIWRNTVQSCMSPAKYNVSEIFVSAPLDLSYKYVLEVPLFLGWRRL
ncbi:type IA DNA topoisomerase, partial [bacterium]|nr:type IA DNA topoisomerase [bacterium]